MNSRAFRNKKPPQLKIIKFNLPETQSFRLENNLQVYFVQKSSLPFLYMSLVADAGSKFDTPGKKGLSNLIAMVIDEGAGEYDALGLSDQFEILGANFNISCDRDSLYFTLQVLKEEFERGADLFTTIIADSHLYEEDFNREKRKVITRILQKRDDADEIANDVFEYKLFGEKNSYAFPSIGYKNDIELISLQDLRDYHKNILVPENAFLTVVGDYDTDALKDLLNKNFSKWKHCLLNKPGLTLDSEKHPGVYIVDKKDSVQTEIRTGLISYGRNEYDFFARSILNLILGGQFSSRLNLNLREIKGFTYGIYSLFNYLKSSAYFYITTSVSSENSGAAVNEIFNEIDNIRKGVTKRELDFAKSSLVRKFPSGFESFRQIASNIIGQVIHSLSEDYFSTYTAEIRKVTLERVGKAAVDNLLPDRLTTVVVGNKEKIYGQLKGVLSGDIIELDETGQEI